MYNMKKWLLLVLCLCLVFVAFSGATVLRAAAAVSLPSGVLIGDQDGIRVDAQGNYYIDARGLNPGDVIHKTVTIQNLSQNDSTPEGKVPYMITMTAEALLSQGPVDLLDKVQLVLKLDGRTIYTGRVRGNGAPNMVDRALDLGTYSVGDRRVLDITLTVDPDIKISEKKSEADFKWKFYAYRAYNTDPPKTGLIEDDWMYLLPMAGALFLFVFLVTTKEKRKQKQAVSVRPSVIRFR